MKLQDNFISLQSLFIYLLSLYIRGVKHKAHVLELAWQRLQKGVLPGNSFVI